MKMVLFKHSAAQVLLIYEWFPHDWRLLLKGPAIWGQAYGLTLFYKMRALSPNRVLIPQDTLMVLTLPMSLNQFIGSWINDKHVCGLFKEHHHSLEFRDNSMFSKALVLFFLAYVIWTVFLSQLFTSDVKESFKLCLAYFLWGGGYLFGRGEGDIGMPSGLDFEEQFHDEELHRCSLKAQQQSPKPGYSFAFEDII